MMYKGIHASRPLKVYSASCAYCKMKLFLKMQKLSIFCVLKIVRFAKCLFCPRAPDDKIACIGNLVAPETVFIDTWSDFVFTEHWKAGRRERV